VDKILIRLKINKKLFTLDVENEKSRVYNHSGKKNQKKFCTYQRHIILIISL